ncbi:3-hydroxybutyrate dehydrogenase [Pantoea rodasii]|uniref:3-hydroxybutyrate dehydrogenase n=1 Tax=Pantoea rodasii TaxID=1076549 RepID=A0A2M9W6H7_9GAMM|nr:3-hydroxybutyrate dehydrogenase [Pantoea rodasii]
MPSIFFGTNAWAAPWLGLIGTLFIIVVGLLWLDRQRRRAQANQEPYGTNLKNEPETAEDIRLPHPLIAILVNNAGIQYTAPVESFPVEKWDAIIAINLSSVFHTSRAALPGMQARHWGRIINIASVHGLVASKEKAAYVAAKHGVVGLTKVIALENAQSPITCNAICPGWVLTPLVQQQIDKRIAAGEDAETARLALLSEKQPAQAFVTPEQLGALVLFLCGEGGAQVRGAAWNMDGGWLAQ